MIEEDDFIELDRPGKPKPASLPALMRCVELRGGTERISLLLEEELLAQVPGAGWPRFSVAYSPKQGAFRLRADGAGRIEATKLAKGTKHMLRVPVPPGFAFIKGESALIVEPLGDALLLFVTGQHRPESAGETPVPKLRLQSQPPLLSRKVAPPPSSSMGSHNSATQEPRQAAKPGPVRQKPAPLKVTAGAMALAQDAQLIKGHKARVRAAAAAVPAPKF